MAAGYIARVFCLRTTFIRCDAHVLLAEQPLQGRRNRPAAEATISIFVRMVNYPLSDASPNLSVAEVAEAIHAQPFNYRFLVRDSLRMVSALLTLNTPQLQKRAK